MRRSRYAAALCTVALASAGGCFDRPPPPVPDGYPVLGELEDGKAVLLIDGREYVTEHGGGTRFNIEGGFEDELDAWMSFDLSLYFDFRDVEPGTYEVSTGDLEAEYKSRVASIACGPAALVIAGNDKYKAGFDGKQEFIWGTISVVACEDSWGSEEPGEPIEITGRFTSIVDRR